MSRIVIIGGSGHVGTYLVPMLVERGHHVVNISRGTAVPYHPHSAWSRVEQVVADRKAEETSGTFGKRIMSLKPDVVIDMIAFELESVQHLVEALQGQIQHYIFCSTIWVYGHSVAVPAAETDVTIPIDDYGKKKLEIERYLMDNAKLKGFPATSFRPGHIVGQGWRPVNPQGNLNVEVFSTIAHGRELRIPNIGLETVNHVHAEDCARWVISAMDSRSASIGECFNTVAKQAMTLRGLAEGMYRYFGQEPKLTYIPIDLWAEGVAEDDIKATRSHVTHSPCCSVEKSRVRLGWEPRYTSLEAIQEAVEHLIKEGKIQVPGASTS